MLLWMPGGQFMMVDLGSTKNRGLVREDAFKYFAEHTPFKDPHQWLEWLVLTHGDIDHYNFVDPFLKKFNPNIRNVLHGGLADEYGGTKGLISKLSERENSDGTKPAIYTGTNLHFADLDPSGAMKADVVALATGVVASAGDKGYVKNTRSVVLRIHYKGIALMLMGDATRDTERAIVSFILSKGGDPRAVIPANVLKVGHHGSHRTSNLAQWFSIVDPNYAFISSDRAGSLDPDERLYTGHRLPQMLTLDILRAYAKRLQLDCAPHTYVSSYQRTDYEEYNSHPDVPGQLLPIPTNPNDLEWIQSDTRQGIFSTLAVMGTSTDPDDEGAADQGVQYRVTIGDNGEFDIYATLDFSKYTKLSP
jgi:hypothetical protein